MLVCRYRRSRGVLVNTRQHACAYIVYDTRFCYACLWMDPSIFFVINGHVWQTNDVIPTTSTLQVVERDLLLQEKEKLYNEMKGILARQVNTSDSITTGAT